MLSRVEANAEQYKSTVPSFLCDEHITSQELHDGKLKHATTADALFRVTRSSSPGAPPDESRQVTSIDGKPSTEKKLKLPITFSGGFGGALAKYLSAERHQCFDYQPDPAYTGPAGTNGYTFIPRPAAANEPVCASILPGTTGKFVVDTTSMQVLHIERTVPHPVGRDHGVLGTVAVDFAPVTLNGAVFRLPRTISAFTSETPKTDAFQFTAQYTHYHRFAASSTILPVTTSPPQ
ncbi:MAG: hypothetical protein M3Y50_10705 [Acidobacteriota bacterium]|nr:hypothetical protein [Acidobacteriota bacterium]